MRQGDSREAQGALQSDTGDQRERGEQHGEPEQRRWSGEWQSEAGETNGRGDPRLRGLQGVSELAKEQGGSWEKVESDHEQWLTELENTAEKLTKRGKRVVQQGIAALKQAERCVQEIMNLVRTEPIEVEKTGWQNFQTEAFDPTSERPLKSQKEDKKYADLFGLTTEQLKVVAEIYNPKRFQGEAKKQGLLPGKLLIFRLGMIC